MSNLPEVQINVQDPGLGIVPASAGRTMALLGVCQKGTVDAVYSAGTIGAARDAIGDGPLLDLAAQVLSVAGGPVILVPTNPSTFGTMTATLTQSGSGSGIVTATKGPETEIKVKIGTGGALAVATFQVSINGGAYGALITTGANPYTVACPGQHFSKLAFANDTYTAADVFTLKTDGTITHTGGGTATSLDGSTHSPVDDYDVVVAVTAAGARGVATFKVSLDGGRTYGGDVLTAATYVIPNTGIVLAFSNDTYVALDTYSGTATMAASATGEVTSALVALRANPSEWGGVYVVGTPSSAANADTLAGIVGAQTLLAFSQFRFVFGVVECPATESDATIAAAFASYADARVGVAVGQEYLVSPLTGRIPRRSIGWGYIARLAGTKLSVHPGQIAATDGGGNIPNVRQIAGFTGGRDEFATPALDAARFVTMRSFLGLSGYFITRGRMMAQAGSDFGNIMNRRVMDRACTLVRAALLQFVNMNVRINAKTGHIDERDAQVIEKTVFGKLKSALVNDEQEASSVEVALSRTDNLLSSSTLTVDVSVVPFGYTEKINTQIGFVNPSLRA